MMHESEWLIRVFDLSKGLQSLELNPKYRVTAPMKIIALLRAIAWRVPNPYMEIQTGMIIPPPPIPPIFARASSRVMTTRPTHSIGARGNTGL